jgi:hypothetical protein
MMFCQSGIPPAFPIECRCSGTLVRVGPVRQRLKRARPAAVRMNIGGFRTQSQRRPRMSKGSYRLHSSALRREHRGCVELRRWTASTLRPVRDFIGRFG